MKEFVLPNFLLNLRELTFDSLETKFHLQFPPHPRNEKVIYGGQHKGEHLKDLYEENQLLVPPGPLIPDL